MTKTIKQIKGYLANNNDKCAIVMLCKRNNFDRLISKVKKELESSYKNIRHIKENKKEFNFQVESLTDKSKNVDVTLILVNLYTS